MKKIKTLFIGLLALGMMTACSSKISSEELLTKYNTAIEKISSYESFNLTINQTGTYQEDEKKEVQKIESKDELTYIANPTQSYEKIEETNNDKTTVTTLYEKDGKYYLNANNEKKTLEATNGLTLTTLVAQYKLSTDFEPYIKDIKTEEKDGITTYQFKLEKNDIKDKTKENSTDLLKSNFNFEMSFKFDKDDNLLEYTSKSDNSTIELKFSNINKVEKIDFIDFSDYPEVEVTEAE